MTRRNAQDVRIYKIIGGDTEATFDDRQVFADRPSRVEAARQIRGHRSTEFRVRPESQKKFARQPINSKISQKSSKKTAITASYRYGDKSRVANRSQILQRCIVIQYRIYLMAILIGLMTAGFGARAFAMRGEITKPSGIAFSSTYPHTARLEVERTLADSGAEFVRGHFINWVSTLHFRGDVFKLNTMVGGLSRCERTTVSIKLEELDEDYDWTIVHDALSNRFQITVNLRSARISLKELSIPDIHSTN